jgi:nucleoid-associated protein YgaU
MQKFLLTTFLLLCSCAAVPPPPAKLEPARYAVARAYAGGASELAREDYLRAKGKLTEGEQLSREGETERADLFLSQAIYFALRARQKSEETWKTILSGIDEKEIQEPESAPADDFEVKILGAKAIAEKEMAPEVSAPDHPAPPKPSPPRPDPPPLPGKYVVRDGETLWSIAALRTIYRDALLWPLIYKANRDQIKDPRQIFPQQVLTIPRNVTSEEKKAAREKARRSEIFPVEVLMRQLVGDEK